MKSRIYSVLFLLLFAGCGNVEPQGVAPNPGGQANGQLKARQAAPAPQNMADPVNVAWHLEDIAKRVPHVNNARCVMFGNTAIVGIDVDPELERSEVGTIKYSVAEALRKDPYGVNAIVTADMDLNRRLIEIRDDILAGHPIAAFTNELADIVGRIMPQLPRDLPQPTNEPPGTEDTRKLPEKSL